MTEIRDNDNVCLPREMCDQEHEDGEGEDHREAELPLLLSHSPLHRPLHHRAWTNITPGVFIHI